MSGVKLPNIAPHAAAQELRAGIKQARNHMKEGAYSSSNLSYKWKKLQSRVENKNKERGNAMLSVDNQLVILREAITSRRARVGLDTLALLQNRLNQERSWANQAIGCVLEQPSYYFGAEDNPGAYPLSAQTLERWNLLIQCIPTQPEMPGDQKDMIIRAIVAILRANNVQGIEGVTQVIKNIEKEQTNGATEGSTAAVPATT